jgi:EAL domain-containing protein (putative c-di-GMP-specific phosphodiesterase class I)/GGDEF domain-containing protein
MPELSDTFVGALPDLTLVVRADGVIVANLGGRPLGFAERPGDLVGTSINELWTDDVAAQLNLLLRRTLRTRAPVDRRYQYKDRDYEVRVQPKGFDRVMMVLRDVSASSGAEVEPPAAADRPDAFAPEDRAAFEARLESAVAISKLRETPLFLAVVHLGGLRDARNTLTPQACSRLIAAVLKTLQSPATLPGEARPSLSPFGRIRNDLLVVLLSGMSGRAAAGQTAERIRRAFAAPLVQGDRSCSLRPAIGIAELGPDGDTPAMLLENARAALSSARHSDHDSTVSFCSTMAQIPEQARPDFEDELRWALEHGQLALHYQPVLALESGRVVAFEAVVRWHHPVVGEMSPQQFLPIAEKSQLGAQIDLWALDQACQDIATLPGQEDMRVVVNIGRRLLEIEHIAERLERSASQAGIDLARLELNMNERIMSTAGSALDRLRELRERGVKLLVDGFGAGRLSLERLRSLPLDGIGIDPAFVSRIEHDAGARAVCLSVISIARAFGLRSVAIGVETPQQLRFLSEHRCDAVQGRFFCAPQPIDHFHNRVFDTAVM